MLYAITIAFIALVRIGQSDSACSGDVDDDMDRIEYRIPLNLLKIQEKGAMTAMEEFLDYLDESLEDVTFLDRFNIFKDSATWYLRSDRTRTVRNLNAAENGAPPSVSLKYRMSHESTPDKYQNDMSLSFLYGDGSQCESVEADSTHEDVFTEKVESNMIVDTCVYEPMKDGQAWQQIEYTGRLRFDDDDSYGNDASDAEDMFPEPHWSAWPMDCDGSEIQDFYDGQCDWFENTDDWQLTVNKNVWNLVLDVDFELTKDKDMDGDLETISEGELTFQIRYNTWADWENNNPVSMETEMSVKAKKKDTDDGYWDETVMTLNAIVNQISGCGNGWIRYQGCMYNDIKRSDCATKRPTDTPTREPSTAAPVTAAPVTMAPVTMAPVTMAPVTMAPVTPAPVTMAPVTMAPVTPAPTTDAPTMKPSMTPTMDRYCCFKKRDASDRWKSKCRAETDEDGCGKRRRYRRNCRWDTCRN